MQTKTGSKRFQSLKLIIKKLLTIRYQITKKIRVGRWVNRRVIRAKEINGKSAVFEAGG